MSELKVSGRPPWLAAAREGRMSDMSTPLLLSELLAMTGRGRMSDYRGMSYEQASREAGRLIEKGWFRHFNELSELHKIMSSQASD